MRRRREQARSTTAPKQAGTLQEGCAELITWASSSFPASGPPIVLVVLIDAQMSCAITMHIRTM